MLRVLPITKQGKIMLKKGKKSYELFNISDDSREELNDIHGIYSDDTKLLGFALDDDESRIEYLVANGCVSGDMDIVEVSIEELILMIKNGQVEDNHTHIAVCKYMSLYS